MQEQSCKRCGGTGWIYHERKVKGIEYEFAEKCSCLDAELQLRRLEASGMAAMIKNYTLDSFKDTEPYQASIKKSAVEYLKEPEGWYFIGGQRGAGKTHICTAICGELLKTSPIQYMRWVDEMRRLKFGNDDMFGKYKQCTYLYIDDLFKTFPDEKERRITFEIIDHRYSNDLPTIISSEKQMTVLRDMDEAIASRIVEKAGRFLINLKDDSSKNYRLRR